MKNSPLDSILQESIGFHDLGATNGEAIGNIFNIFKNIDLYKRELHEFLFTKGWNFDSSQGVYYKTDPNKIFQDFRKLSRSKKGMSTLDLKHISDDVFRMKGILLKDSLPIISNHVETFFVISGIQNIYDNDFILGDKSAFVQQPSIRLNGAGKGNFFVSGYDGIATSFVNPTVYKKNPDVRDLISSIDNFFDFLSTIGIYIGDISLKVNVSDEKWKDESLVKTTIHILYGNLHLGDCGIGHFRNENSLENDFLDLGFGLERINLGRNKMDNYFHQYIQNKVELDRYSDIEIDAIKTICLINSQNIDSLDKHDGVFFKYKKFLKRISKTKNYYPLIKIFLEFRSNFTTFNETEDVVLKKILNDIELYSLE